MTKQLLFLLLIAATLWGCSDNHIDPLEPISPVQADAESNGNAMCFSISAEKFDDPNGILASQTRSDVPSMSPCSSTDILEKGFILSAYREDDGEPLFENYFCKVVDDQWLFYDRETMVFNAYGTLQSLGDPVDAPGWPEVEEGEESPQITFYAIYAGGADTTRIVKDEEGWVRYAFDNGRFLMNSYSDDMVCSYTGSRSDGSIKLNFKHIVSLFKITARLADSLQYLELTQFLATVPRYVSYNFNDSRIEVTKDEMDEDINSKCSAVLDNTMYSVPNSDIKVLLTGTADWGEEGAILNYWGVLMPYDKNLTVSFAYHAESTDFVSYQSTTIQPAAGVMTLCSISLPNPTNEAVDLGLSVNWASCNVGANEPSQMGNYFAWGEVVPFGYSDYDNSNISIFNSATGDDLDDYSDTDGASTLSAYQYWNSSIKGYYCQGTYKHVDSNHYINKYKDTDGDTILVTGDDAATANMGSGWRMPTQAEWQALIDSCTWTATTLNGVSGYEIAGNGNSIFLPFTGIVNGGTVDGSGTYADYWSSNLFVPEEGETENLQAHALYITSSSKGLDGMDRYTACPIRAVLP